MAGRLMGFSGKSQRTLEFVCDTEDEIAYLPTTNAYGTGIFERYQEYAPIGSTCIVGNEGGDLLTYMLFSFGWKQL